MSFPFAEIAREKFREPAQILLDSLNIKPTSEGLKEAVVDFATTQREKYDSKSPMQQLIFLSLWMNTVLAKPAVSLLIPSARVDSMRAAGMNDAAIYTTAAVHSGFDHFIPNLLIGGYALALKESDIPVWLIASGSFLAGRTTWGLLTSAVHEGTFAALELYNTYRSRQYIPREIEGVI